MEKRVILSALIILVASALAFNFGEDNPTGLAYGSHAAIAPGLEKYDITSDVLNAANRAYWLSNKASQGNWNYLDDLNRLLEQYPALAAAANDRNLIDIKSIRKLQTAHEIQYGYGASSNKVDTTTATSCTALQAGDKFCGIEGSDGYRPIQTCTRIDYGRYALIQSSCPTGQTCMSTFNIDPLGWITTREVRCERKGRP